MSRHVSFTERRRASLRKQVDRLELIELRNTITEPISVLGLSLSAYSGLNRLGIADLRAMSSGLSGLTPAAQAIARGGQQTGKAAAPPTNFVPIAIDYRPEHASAAGGGWAQAPAGAAPGNAAARPSRSVDLSALPSALPADSAQHGISAPWHPANNTSGGAALPPRGGSGSGAQSVTSALVQGRTAPRAVIPPPSTPAVPFLPANGPATASANPGAVAPVISRNHAATGLHGGSGSGSAAGSNPGSGASPLVVPDGGPSTGGLTSVPENPSSSPVSSIGNGSGFSAMSFQYFPMYVLDYNNGIDLFNNQYQQATPGVNVDLYAQVKGTTVSTYSWNTTNLGNTAVGSITGTSTYHLHFEWSTTPVITQQTDSVSLTVTNSSSQQETETFYFIFPVKSLVTLPGSASWPVTIPPDMVEAGAPLIPSQGVSVDADSGALDTNIDLPSYNPNVPAISLTYNSMTADPRPIIVVHHTLDPTQTVPTAVNATLTFNSTVGTTWYYNTSSFIPGDVQQIALQANATSLSTGRYGYSVQLVDERSANTTLTYSGTATVLNQSSSP